MYKTIVVEGVIGSGKTHLSRELGAALGSDTLVLLEPDEKHGGNPYLADFYEDMERWCYTMQTHLLARRFRMQSHAQWHALSGSGHVVIDRSYYGDTCFARMHWRQGTMTKREYETYKMLYRDMTASVLLPNVCLRLLTTPEVAHDRIRKRMIEETGRAPEQIIDLDYLRRLDAEITETVEVLRGRGVYVEAVAWDADRDSTGQRAATVTGLAERIKLMTPRDELIDAHRRTT